ncbi:hypothetical protein D3C87_1314470 [compost metagenome]
MGSEVRDKSRARAVQKAAYRAEAWGAEGGRREYAWSDTGYRLLVTRSALLSLLKLAERNLVFALKLQKYHEGELSNRSGDTSAFTHRSLVVVVDGNGQIWSPRGLSRHAKDALATLDVDRRRDFYPRFRAIAGLPDEQLSRGNQVPDLEELYRSFIAGQEPE